MKRGRIHGSNRHMLAGFILGLLILGLFFRGAVSRALQFIERPLVGAGTWITTQTALFQDQRRVTREQIEAFQQEKIAHALLNVQYQTLEREYAQLKKTLGFLEGRAFRSVGASIISRTNSNERSEIVIDRGSDDGMFVGAAVIVEQGLYVGKIISVSRTQSVVSTLTDQDHATAISLLNQTETIGMARGLNGNLAILEFIPLEESVQIDQLAVTSGLETTVPSGLLVGLVNTVRPDPDGPFQQAILEPMVDIKRYVNVVVLLTPAL